MHTYGGSVLQVDFSCLGLVRQECLTSARRWIGDPSQITRIQRPRQPWQNQGCARNAMLCNAVDGNVARTSEYTFPSGVTPPITETAWSLPVCHCVHELASRPAGRRWHSTTRRLEVAKHRFVHENEGPVFAALRPSSFSKPGHDSDPPRAQMASSSPLGSPRVDR